MLLLSEKHWKNQQYGLAVLSSWEAIIERFAAIYQVDVRNSFDNYKRISQIAKDRRALKNIGKKIGNFRNSIAHSETEKSSDPNRIVDSFPYWFKQLKEILNSNELNNLPQKLKF